MDHKPVVTQTDLLPERGLSLLWASDDSVIHELIRFDRKVSHILATGSVPTLAAAVEFLDSCWIAIYLLLALQIANMALLPFCRYYACAAFYGPGAIKAL